MAEPATGHAGTEGRGPAAPGRGPGGLLAPLLPAGEPVGQLVDQDRCRGWRFCVSGCPYKKGYFNYRTGKAEKCRLCFPRVEAGQPTICSETCVGRLRYLGLMLYDADKVLAAAATPDPRDLYPRAAVGVPRPGRPRRPGRGGPAGYPR